jgi:hypothetical protein
MRGIWFFLPVWLFSIGALLAGAFLHQGGDLSAVYTGICTLGVTVANALMFLNRRVRDIERGFQTGKAAGAKE